MGFEYPYELRWWWEYAILFFLRPLFAILFIFSLILLSWFVAWKTVLVHVPLVQEIFGLRKKPVKPKPPTNHRFSRFYNSNSSIRWQHASGIQRGLFPSQQGPMQTVHKSSNRYEVGKSSDEEEHKQRRLKAILNKLRPQNFEKLFSQVKAVKIDNTSTLSGVISQIVDKALMEPTFCEMYVEFFLRLASDLPDFIENNEKITFRRLLLNKCQDEFERGERDKDEANKAEEEGEIRQTKEEREEKRIRARRRMLGNICLIGELYKKKMLTERIMHECIHKLLGYYQNPDEEAIESLCKLMSTIGALIDHSKAKELMDAYFDMMTMLSTNGKLSSRVRFMLKDIIDLRKNKWQQRRKVEGSKNIEDGLKDAIQEGQAQTTRLACGPIISSRWGTPSNFGHRGTIILNSPSSQANTNIRGLPTQARGFGSQDVLHEDRQLYEEEQKQRRLKAILNKLRPQNFEKLFSQVKDIKIDNTLTLCGVISQIVDKALMEPTFCEMYVDFCLCLASELPDFVEHNEKITFRRLLLNKCQYEFERGEREQVEANKAEEEGEIRYTKEEREEKIIRARRRMPGNIRLIVEMYKKKMLTESIMHECIKKLLEYYENPNEEDIESLCKLMSTIGALIDHSKAKELMDAYFERMTMLSTNKNLSSRVMFMLKDIIDLRKNKWQQRRKVEGLKKIEDVHMDDAAQERQPQTTRLARGPVVSSKWGPHANFGHRGTIILKSSSSQTNTNIHGLPT